MTFTPKGNMIRLLAPLCASSSKSQNASFDPCGQDKAGQDHAEAYQLERLRFCSNVPAVHSRAEFGYQSNRQKGRSILLHLL
jgi:hypothetical protein